LVSGQAPYAKPIQDSWFERLRSLFRRWPSG
jgi:hypothetical protein